MSPDTIVAVSTPPGEGGIGIVRLSGTGALVIADRLFRVRSGGMLSEKPPFRLSLGMVIDFRTGDPIDEALAVHMPSGHSYTGESSVEFQAHGGTVILEKIVENAIACGARSAAPGEFTRRAFLNGRLDLSQAEAVADLIRAESEEACRMALRQLQGETGLEIRALQERLLTLVSQAEALLDFSEEEDVPAIVDRARVEALASEVRILAAQGRTGNIIREGVKAVIAGRPNVGKSSLFNRLINSPRSIITPLPGTTRDFIEEKAVVAGVSMVLIDTAGIRDPQDQAEEEGIRKSLELINSSDIVTFLIDGSEPPHPADRDLLFRLKERSPFVVITKNDLPQRLHGTEIQGFISPLNLYQLSVVTGEGCDIFRHSLAQRCKELLGDRRTTFVSPNQRQQEILLRVASHLDQAMDNLRGGDSSLDLVAADLKSSLHCLGEITGETATDDILEQIFSRFCIGK